MARELRPWFGVAKVGLELYSASGPDVVGALLDLDYQVFCDLKFHDIPTTVEPGRPGGRRARRHLPELPRAGRRAPCSRAGVDGFLAGAAERGPARAGAARGHHPHERRPGARAHPPEARAGRARGGVQGDRVRGRRTCTRRSSTARASPRWCPASVRPARPTHDQARAATPEEAMGAGADVLVLGRAVTHADDPAAAAAAVADAIARVA